MALRLPGLREADCYKIGLGIGKNLYVIWVLPLPKYSNPFYCLSDHVLGTGEGWQEASLIEV